MKFKLEIELGNDAMQTPTDVAVALMRAAETIEWGYQELTVDGRGRHGPILDRNGNTVGRWEVKT